MIVSRARVSPAEESLNSVLSSRAGQLLGITARACRCCAICVVTLPLSVGPAGLADGLAINDRYNRSTG